ncbi:MAG: hypothetical protein MJZ34_04805 [Paludibacteraceae bacterium]|nr:hypothetical protein [Paludibacteraceae bacterium]
MAIVATSKTDYIKQLKVLISTNKTWCEHAIKVLYSFQTAEEKATETTHVVNGKGFTSNDAEILSSMAMNIEKWGSLTDKQFAWIGKKVSKYAGQILDYCLEKGSVVKLDGKYQNKPKA